MKPWSRTDMLCTVVKNVLAWWVPGKTRSGEASAVIKKKRRRRRSSGRSAALRQKHAKLDVLDTSPHALTPVRRDATSGATTATSRSSSFGFDDDISPPGSYATSIWKARRQDMTELEDVFRFFDSNSDGYLTAAEAFAALKAKKRLRKKYLTDEESWLHVNKVRECCHDRLSIHEFRELWRAQTHLHKPGGREDVDALSQADQHTLFQRIDEDADGLISGKELYWGLRRHYRFSCSRRMCRMLENLETSDFNSDRFMLSERDFHHLLKLWGKQRDLNRVCRRMHHNLALWGRFTRKPVAMLTKPPPYLGTLAELADLRRVKPNAMLNYDTLSVAYVREHNHELAVRKRKKALHDLAKRRDRIKKGRAIGRVDSVAESEASTWNTRDASRRIFTSIDDLNGIDDRITARNQGEHHILMTGLGGVPDDGGAGSFHADPQSLRESPFASSARRLGGSFRQ